MLFRRPSGEHGYACAAVSERQTVAVFHSSRPGGYGAADIWFSRWENDRWTEPQNAGPGVNTQEHEVDPSLSPDGSTMFFSRSVFGGATAVSKLPPGADKQTDLYVSHFRDWRWTKAERIPEPVCLREAAEYRAMLSHDGNRLYFGSDRAGGYGGFDLYVSHRTTTGGWGEPENLGPLVNTAGKEVDAAIAPHENTLVLAFQGEKDSFQKLLLAGRLTVTGLSLSTWAHVSTRQPAMAVPGWVTTDPRYSLTAAGILFWRIIPPRQEVFGCSSIPVVSEALSFNHISRKTSVRSLKNHPAFDKKGD